MEMAARVSGSGSDGGGSSRWRWPRRAVSCGDHRALEYKGQQGQLKAAEKEEVARMETARLDAS